MIKTIDLINVPTGYSKDITDFCVPVLEMALLRGENEYTFDPDFFFEFLDRQLQEQSELIVLYNARRYLCDNRMGDEPEPYDAYQNEFEHGCKYFIEAFLDLNQLKAIHNLGKDVWNVTLKPITPSLWQMTRILNDKLNCS